MTSQRITAYSREVLSFQLGADKNAMIAPAPSPEDMEKYVKRCARIFQGSGADTLVLFGTGSGGFLKHVEPHLPEQARLIVCDLNVNALRGLSGVISPRWEIVADISIWAHFCLLGLEGIIPETACLMLNPELAQGKERTDLQAMQRLFTQARLHALPRRQPAVSNDPMQPSLSAGAILSPDEPDLDHYFSQFPAWLKELCIVWDAETVPEKSITCACPVRQEAHPLDNFSAQRNRMKGMCSGDWLLYLDGDECFSSQDWEALPLLMRLGTVESCHFTRQTLYPDEQHTKVGFGLWPDLQLRLFRNSEQVVFERPVHEKLTGVQGHTAIALDIPIKHYSRLRKSPECLKEKLSRFDQAGGTDILHRLNEEYPSLSCALLEPDAKDDFIRIFELPISPA